MLCKISGFHGSYYKVCHLLGYYAVWLLLRIGELGTTSAVTSNRFLVTANVVSSSMILLTLMMEALSSSETSVPIRAKRSNIPEDYNLHSHRRVNLKSYILHVSSHYCLNVTGTSIFNSSFRICC
jgi:hypothetical protein